MKWAKPKGNFHTIRVVTFRNTFLKCLTPSHDKKSKITAVPTAFPLESLSIKQPPKYSASKGNAVGTAAILNFF